MQRVLRDLVLFSILCSILVSSKGFCAKLGKKRIKAPILRQDSCVDHHKCSQWLDFTDLLTSCKIKRNQNNCKKSCQLCTTTSTLSTRTTIESTSTTVKPTNVTTVFAFTGGPCIDHPKCDEWLNPSDLYISCKNESNRNNCRKSCKNCTTTPPPSTTQPPTTTTTSSANIGGSCVDRSQHCSGWVINGYCSTKPTSMRYYCIFSCGFCTLKTTASVCVDQKPKECPTWVHACFTNSDVMKYCQKTCQLCTTSLSTTGSSSTTTTISTTTAPYTTGPGSTSTIPTTRSTSTTTTKTTLTNSTSSTTTPTSTSATLTASTVTEISDITNTEEQLTKPTTQANTNNKPTKVPPRRPLTGKINSSTLDNTAGISTATYPTAGLQQAMSSANTTVIVAVCVSGILLATCAVLIVHFYRRRKKQNDALVSSTPRNLIMQSFNYSESKSRDTKRDSGIVYCDEDIYTNPTNEQPVYHVLEGPSNQQPIYHVLEDNRTEPVYACAAPDNGLPNQAFEPEYDYTVPEGVVTSLVSSALRPQGEAGNVSTEEPYYRVLEDVPSGRYQELIRPMQHNGYQPIIRREK